MADPNETLKTAEQLLLDLRPRSVAGKRSAELEITEANALAARFLAEPELWTNGLGALVGPRGSGKTTLASNLVSALRTVAPQEVAALGERAAQGGGAMGRARPEDALLSDLASGRALLFDDLDRALDAFEGPSLEQGLFHLANLVASARGAGKGAGEGEGSGKPASLLVTGREPPARWGVRLPDLRTRLEAATLARIEPPDDRLLTAILQRSFRARGVAVDDRAIKYLAARMERDYPAAQDLVSLLDSESLRLGRPITSALAGEALGWVPRRF